MHLTKIDCKPYNRKKNSVEATLNIDTFQDLTRRNFLVGSQDVEGCIHNSFVMGKPRVRPLRSGISVPKMELTAATLLITMNKLITKELEGRIAIHSPTFWTCSMIVLRYIFNETRRFVTFVAYRVAIIREGSKPSQWRHVRSESTPADLASRGMNASDTEKLEMWKHGPDFL